MALWTIIQTVICLYIMTRGDQRNSTSTQLPWYLWCSSLPSTTAHVLYPVSCEHSLCLRWTTVRYSIKEHVPVANYMTRENILLGIIWFHLYPANHIYLSCRMSGLKKGWLWTEQIQQMVINVGIYRYIDIDIFVHCNCTDTRWQ